jgi:hypothetical protein
MKIKEYLNQNLKYECQVCKNKSNIHYKNLFKSIKLFKILVKK